MIIEIITTYSVLKVTMEMLELAHFAHVGHSTAESGYHFASNRISEFANAYQKYQDEKNPEQKIQRLIKTIYDLNDTETLEDLNNRIKRVAENYLKNISNKIDHLKATEKHFVQIHKTLLSINSEELKDNPWLKASESVNDLNGLKGESKKGTETTQEKKRVSIKELKQALVNEKLLHTQLLDKKILSEKSLILEINKILSSMDREPLQENQEVQDNETTKESTRPLKKLKNKLFKEQYLKNELEKVKTLNETLIKEKNSKEKFLKDEKLLLNVTQIKSSISGAANHLNQASFLMDPPDRGILYLYDFLNKDTKTIDHYNNNLKTIKSIISLIADIKKVINNQITEMVEMQKAQPSTSRSFSLEGLEAFEDKIKDNLNDKDYLSQKIQSFISGKKELLTNLLAILTVCEKTNQSFPVLISSNQQTQTAGVIEAPKVISANVFDTDPNWFPLWNQSEQIEVGQRMFLQIMDEENKSSATKLEISEIFLKQSVPKEAIAQHEADRLLYEMAAILREWQINKLDTLMRFVMKLKNADVLELEDGSDEVKLLIWIKNGKTGVTALELLNHLLTMPCNFSACNKASAIQKLTTLKINDDIVHKIIKSHIASDWSYIWRESDKLIQLPIAPKIKLINNGSEDDASYSNLCTDEMGKLAELLLKDFNELHDALMESKNFYKPKALDYKMKKEAAMHEYDKNVYDNRLDRIRIAKVDIQVLKELTGISTIFNDFLCEQTTHNESCQRTKAHTVDDLLHIIFNGVDVNEPCLWKEDTLSNKSGHLSSYFIPKTIQDSNYLAYLYALEKCGVNTSYLLSKLYHPSQNKKVKNNTKDLLSMVAMLNETNQNQRLMLISQSPAMHCVKPKEAEQIVDVLLNLQAYFINVLTKMDTAARKALPLAKRLEALYVNLLKMNNTIGEVPLESSRRCMGVLSIALLADLSREDIPEIKEKINYIKKEIDYIYIEERYSSVKNAEKSYLYGPIKQGIKDAFNTLFYVFGSLAAMKEYEMIKNISANEEEEDRNLDKNIEEERKARNEALKEREILHKELAVLKALVASLPMQEPDSEHTDKQNPQKTATQSDSISSSQRDPIPSTSGVNFFPAKSKSSLTEEETVDAESRFCKQNTSENDPTNNLNFSFR